MGLRLPPQIKIDEIILCYHVSNPESLIAQVQLVEMTTPDHALVRHDDPTGLKSPSPQCYRSKVGEFIPIGGHAEGTQGVKPKPAPAKDHRAHSPAASRGCRRAAKTR